jgi:hypothetical protein
MHISYGDILSRIGDEPLWWLDGVPRFLPFKPGDVGVYRSDTALVHTECQGCRKRYDVAVRGAYLKENIAYMSSLDLGDPPNACCRVGPTMSSNEIRVLQYWKPTPFPESGWERIPEWERQLVDADDGSQRSEPIIQRLYAPSHKVSWQAARNDGNFLLMVSILKEIGCELPERVAHMLDAERRRDQLERTIGGLNRARSA